jgi:hypothetical protein
MNDAYASYEAGLDALLVQLRSHPRYSEALVYEQRLRENIQQCRIYGDNDTRTSARSEVLARLNVLASNVLNTSFNDLCAVATAPQVAVPSNNQTAPISATRTERNQSGERHARPADANTNATEQLGELGSQVEGLENDIGKLEKDIKSREGANSVSANPKPNGGWKDKPVTLIAPAGLVVAIIVLLLSGIVPLPGGEFFYQVRLKDENTMADIATRPVIIEVDGRQFQANTGSDGLARVKIPSEFEGRPGKIIISVTGYEYKEQSIDVNDTGTSTTVLLTPKGDDEEAEAP